MAQLNPVGIGGGWHQVDRGQEEEQDKHKLTELLPNCKSAHGPEHSNSTQVNGELCALEGEQARQELLSSESSRGDESHVVQILRILHHIIQKVLIDEK